jgi:hypothetical protein
MFPVLLQPSSRPRLLLFRFQFGGRTCRTNMRRLAVRIRHAESSVLRCAFNRHPVFLRSRLPMGRLYSDPHEELRLLIDVPVKLFHDDLDFAQCHFRTARRFERLREKHPPTALHGSSQGSCALRQLVARGFHLPVPRTRKVSPFRNTAQTSSIHA